MSRSYDGLSDTCQVKTNLEYKEPLRRKRLRYWLALRRWAIRKRNMFSQIVAPVTGPIPGTREFQPGEWVMVKPLGEIKATLDNLDRIGGCKFLKPMAQYCGQKMRVLRRVNRFYDEQQSKIVRCHNIALLEGSHCTGTDGTHTERCDRFCFFFWRDEWLEPANEQNE